MDLDQIVNHLQVERARINTAIEALEGAVSMNHRRPYVRHRERRGGARTMSAEARNRIARAMRKRWREARRRGQNRL